MGSTATIETKLGKSLDDIIKTKTTGSKPKPAAASPKKAVPVGKTKAKVLTVSRKQQKGMPGTRGAPNAPKGSKGNVQSRLQKVQGGRPNGRPNAAQGIKNVAANGRILAQQAASQAAREATLAKKRGVQTSTLKGRLAPANPITAGRVTSVANRVRPAGGQKQQGTVLQGVRTAPAQRNSEPMKFKITIVNDVNGKGKGRGNQPVINMPGGGNHNTKSMLRGANGSAGGIAGRITAVSNGGRAALPGPGKSLSERFSLLSKSAKGANGPRRDQGYKVNRNAAGVVMPF